VLLTEAKRSDVKLADSFRLNPGLIVAMDRGYINYALFARWSMAGVFFVTGLKENAAFEVVAECQIPQNRNIRADQFIRLTGIRAQANYPDLLRRNRGTSRFSLEAVFGELGVLQLSRAKVKTRS
jgi:hypothetical protein